MGANRRDDSRLTRDLSNEVGKRTQNVGERTTDKMAKELAKRADKNPSNYAAK